MLSRRNALATCLTAAGLFLAAGASGLAQDATPAAAAAHPAHIHVGTCDNLDPNPTHMLSDVTGTAAVPAAGAAIPVELSVTTVDAPLDDLRTGGYAINIHKSVDEIGTYIACGNLTSPAGDAATSTADTLVVGLGELNDSGETGIAVLTAKEAQTEVVVYLAQGLAGSGMAAMAQASEAAPATGATDGTAVEIKDFAYAPATLTIPAGSTVTWTNDDTVPHTATAQDRAALQSGTLEPGASFSQTFAAPGTFDYFCEFHANMKGQVIVQ